MPTILTIPEIIELGDVSTYLSANYTSKQQLFGGNITKPVPPVQIQFVTDALRWAYDGGAQTAASLRSTANYLYWLCGMFQLQAQNIINGPGGGTVIPITPGTSPNPIDFIVSGSSLIPTSGTTVNIPQFIGYNVDFARGGVEQYTTPPGDGTGYYNWNKVTGDFTLIDGPAIDGERFRLSPYL